MTTQRPATAQRPVTAQRLQIDWTACDGRGGCIELLPELLDRDPWGYPLGRSGQRDPEVPEPLLGPARSAVGLCPRLALRLTPPTA
jgi:ferredoxin